MNTVNLLLLAVEAALASFILPLLAALLSRAFPRSAGRRRLVWVTMFAVLLALPLVAMLSPTLAVIALPGPSDVSPDALGAYVPAPALAPPAEAAAPPATVFSGAAGAILLALCAWALGALWIVVRSLVGLIWLLRLRFQSASLPPERLPLPLPRRCSVRLSSDCPGPITWGAAWPVILLPDDALDWPAARLEAALRHELAHVVRRDSLIQALALLACALYWPNPLVWRAANALRREAESAADDAVIACALYWPNPLVWGAARALRREAELAADDAVIAAGVKPSDYAGQLLELAAEWRERRLTPTGLAMAAPPALSQRVQSILSTDAIRTGATPMDAFKLVLLGGAGTSATLGRARVRAAVATPPRRTSFTVSMAVAPVRMALVDRIDCTRSVRIGGAAMAISKAGWRRRGQSPASRGRRRAA